MMSIVQEILDMRPARADAPACRLASAEGERPTASPGSDENLPPQLHVPTKKELNDKLTASIHDPGDRPARLDWALRSRARRAVIRK